MIRPVLTELLLLAVPFAAYALFLWATQRGGVLDRANWPISRVIWLVAAAVVLFIGSIAVLTHWGSAPPGSTYIPAHMENGKLVPGRTK